jgi:hypothetical protein
MEPKTTRAAIPRWIASEHVSGRAASMSRRVGSRGSSAASGRSSRVVATELVVIDV